MAECLMSGNGFAVDGQLYEIREFLPAASYSLNAKITTQTPFDAEAFYFGRIDNVGTQVGTPALASVGWGVKLCNTAVPTVTANGLCINALHLSFSKDGDSQCTLAYMARQNLSGNAVSSTSPTSMNIGPVWMVKKI